MTQYARPDADDAPGNWDNSEDDGTDMFSYCNDGDTNTFMKVESYSAEQIILSLSAVSTPDTGTRTVTIVATDQGGMDSITLTATLREGTAGKGNNGGGWNTLGSDPTAGAATNSFNITSSIVNYGNLNIIITATDAMGMGSEINVHDIYFAVPDEAAEEAAATSPAFLLFLD